MFKSRLVPALVAALVVSGATALSASATPLAPANPAVAAETTANPLLTEVDVRVRIGVGGGYWDRRRHGPRCLRRYGNCRHFYRGYYYVSPWWLLPPPVVKRRVIVRGGARRAKHVAWCEGRYRSYDRETNTWVAYSGEVRQCISPYY